MLRGNLFVCWPDKSTKNVKNSLAGEVPSEGGPRELQEIFLIIINFPRQGREKNQEGVRRNGEKANGRETFSGVQRN